MLRDDECTFPGKGAPLHALEEEAGSGDADDGPLAQLGGLCVVHHVEYLPEAV